MPHIHTAPNQHDMVVSAFIVRTDLGEPKVLLHMHRKHNILMQVGGHIELDETPWQAIARELREECGYSLADLQVLQPDAEPAEVMNVITHPLPVFVSTYKLPDEHYHSDLAWAFVTDHEPKQAVNEDESSDIRWLTITELHGLAVQGTAAKDVTEMYERIVKQHLPAWFKIPAQKYSLAKPRMMSM